MIGFLLSIFAVFLFTPFLALASNVSVSGNTTLVLPGDGSSYTLTGGKFTSLVIGNTSFSFVMTAGDFLDVISPDKKNLTNSLNIKTDCETNQSRVRIALAAGESSQTITITPSGSCTTSTGAGGGVFSGAVGGGGGGGGINYPPLSVAQAPAAAVPASSKVPIAAKPSAIAQTVSPVFNKNLIRGARNTDVKRLQQLLASDKSIYPEGTASGFFGPATEKAIRRFQLKYGIIKKAADSGNGKLGPQTRAKFKQVFGSAAVPAVSPTASITPSTSAAVTQTTDAEKIKALQKQLELLQQQLKNLQK